MKACTVKSYPFLENQGPVGPLRAQGPVTVQPYAAAYSGERKYGVKQGKIWHVRNIRNFSAAKRIALTLFPSLYNETLSIVTITGAAV